MMEQIAEIIDKINVVLLRVKHDVELLNQDEISAISEIELYQVSMHMSNNSGCKRNETYHRKSET